MGLSLLRNLRLRGESPGTGCQWAGLVEGSWAWEGGGGEAECWL